MIEEKEEVGPGMPANDPGDSDVGDFPDEGVPRSPEERLAAVEAELGDTKDRLLRALDAMPEAEVTDPRTRSLLDGVAATERELLAAFERSGLMRIDPKGERFDHNFHQAIFEAERPGAPAGTVIEVLQPGYLLHDRLLRPAMVGVAKAGAEGDDAG